MHTILKDLSGLYKCQKIEENCPQLKFVPLDNFSNSFLYILTAIMLSLYNKREVGDFAVSAVDVGKNMFMKPKWSYVVGRSYEWPT